MQLKLFRTIFRRKNRNLPSVSDYQSEQEIHRALGGEVTKINSDQSISTLLTKSDAESEQLSLNCVEKENDLDDIPVVDWKLPMFDAETTHVQTLEKELQRLMILRSFNLLDTGREKHFDRLVELAAEIFHVPIALISLVDLGRQWFLSTEGLDPSITETPREISICAHVVQGKKNQPLVIPDLTKDIRFMENPVVTGPLALRFYAGAPLISPEGYKIGSFCVIDTIARPEGFSYFDEEVLMDLANMAMKIMVQRREKLISLQKPQTNLQSLSPVEFLESFDRIICPITDLQKLYEGLNTIIDPLPRSVPISMGVDPKLPPRFECDDLLLFRSALILLNNAATRTTSGTINFLIGLENDGQSIVFTCEDTGEPKINPDVKFVPSDKSPLFVLQSMVRKMHGTFGVSRNANSDNVFWFQVPCNEVSMYESIKDIGTTAEIFKTPSLLSNIVHEANILSKTSDSMKSPTDAMKDLVISNDPFQGDLLTLGCTPLASYKPSTTTEEKE